MTSEPLERRVVAPEHWDRRWADEKDPRFHRKVYSPNLERFYSKVYGKGDQKRIFVPLCGKTLDLIFLADNGNEVVGLEFSKIAVESFFDENNLIYTISEVENAPFVKYQAKEKNITIFRGELFALNPDICGRFDGVWDRGSYVAINVPTRKTYVELMSSLVRPGGRILLEATDYDPTKFCGPPHYTTEENVRSYFGENFEAEVLLVDHDSAPDHFKVLDMGYTIHVFMLTRK